jgi:hypothetical protein
LHPWCHAGGSPGLMELDEIIGDVMAWETQAVNDLTARGKGP